MINRNHRKTGLLLLILALGLLLLTGCGKNTPEASASAVSYSTESETSIQPEAKQDETVTEEVVPEDAVPEAAAQPESSQSENADTEPEHADTLVVYFSATGNTAPLAEYTAEYLSADIYEIVPEIEYTDADLDYGDDSSRTSIEQNDDSARPPIAGTLPDLSGYDTVIIGHPIWWGQAPKIIYTFIESYDWSGKTVVTFCTSGSSGLGSSAENLKPSAIGNPNWLESRRFPIGAGRDEVIDWLQQILP